MALETPQATAPNTVTTKPLDEQSARLLQADLIIHRNVLWSLGAGIVPVPLADVVAVTAVQVKLLKELSDLYGVAFKQHLAKKLVSSLLVSISGVAVGVALGASLAKLVPGVGTALGMVSVPLASGAFTHATGRVFVMHFEAGGTLLDFDPRKMREHFRAEFEAAKDRVAQLHQQQSQPSSEPAAPPTGRQPV